MSAIPLILDVDTGVDDALALLLSLASPEVELIGATCVMGNVRVEQATENTLAVLELGGRTDIEVATGASQPLVRDHTRFPEVHGERGLGDAQPAPATARPSERAAAQLIVDTVRERPGEILLVATGPLTNVALALSDEPALPTLLRGFAIMGGAFGRGGNVTPAAEANIWVDPDAAQVVFRGWAGAPEPQLPIAVGLDVTELVKMDRPDVDAVAAAAPDSPLARFLQDAVPFYIDFYERSGKPGGASMHDPLALAVAIDPSLAQLETTRIEVELAGLWTTGMTVADLRGIRTTRWPAGWEAADNARVATGVDAPAFMDLFLGRLTDLVRSRA